MNESEVRAITTRLLDGLETGDWIVTDTSPYGVVFKRVPGYIVARVLEPDDITLTYSDLTLKTWLLRERNLTVEQTRSLLERLLGGEADIISMTARL